MNPLKYGIVLDLEGTYTMKMPKKPHQNYLILSYAVRYPVMAYNYKLGVFCFLKTSL